jgi:hypothetical protein
MTDPIDLHEKRMEVVIQKAKPIAEDIMVLLHDVEELTAITALCEAIAWRIFKLSDEDIRRHLLALNEGTLLAVSFFRENEAKKP